MNDALKRALDAVANGSVKQLLAQHAQEKQARQVAERGRRLNDPELAQHRAENRMNSAMFILDDLLKSGERFSRLHPRLAHLRPGTVTESMRQRVALGEAILLKPADRRNAVPAEWIGARPPQPLSP